MIAKTEVARTASALTMARATHIGATHYYWRTSSDADVRKSHKKMNGKIIEWANPPKVDENVEPYHAGMIWFVNTLKKFKHNSKKYCQYINLDWVVNFC